MTQDKVDRDGQIRVLIVEDNLVVTRGLRALLAEFPDRVTVVGDATNVEDAKESVQELSPDLVLLDLQLPREPGVLADNKTAYKHGIELINYLKKTAKNVRILVNSDFGRAGDDEPNQIQLEYLVRAVRAGAHGYIAKYDNYNGAQYTEASEAMMQDQAVYWAPLTGELFNRILEDYRRNRENIPERKQLTAREQEVAEELKRHKSDEEIADKFGYKLTEVKSIVKGIFEKLGISDRDDPALDEFLE